MSYNRIGDMAGKRFGEALSLNKILRNLNLSHNHLSSDCAEDLVNGMKNNEKLTHLDISHNVIPFKTLQVL